jgi:NAD(P)H-hydrate epimerase
MVLDADGLNILAAGRRWPAGFKARAVLTPHPGEMARLGGLMGRSEVPADEEGRVETAAAAAAAFGQTIVLKGHRTVVCDGRRFYVNDTGDSTLAKGGSGDVLSGMLGCLLAQGMERFDAAVLAVHLHGRAGEAAGRRFGKRWALAREVIAALAEVLDDQTRP